MEKISAIIITKNEEKLINKVLNAISWCDEIIIVDSGSVDNTIEICKKYNCKIYFKDFNGFGEQKRFAVSKTSNDWILSVDADEIVSDKLKAEITQLLKDDYKKYNGYYIPIKLHFLNKILKYGGASIKKKLRLFNKKAGDFNLKTVHESIELSGGIGQLKNPIIHYSYSSIFDYFHKFNSYTETAATELYKKNKKTNFMIIIIRLPFEFIKRYFIQLGVLDGKAGFIWSLFCAFYPVVKYFKLYEKRLNTN